MAKKKQIEMVMPASGVAPDLDNMDVDTMVAEYHVPKSIFDLISGAVPSFIKDGLKKFVSGVPTLDREEGVMKIDLTIKDDSGQPNILAKLRIDMTGSGNHTIKVSTDSGDTWRELTLKSTTASDVKAVDA